MLSRCTSMCLAKPRRRCVIPPQRSADLRTESTKPISFSLGGSSSDIVSRSLSRPAFSLMIDSGLLIS